MEIRKIEKVKVKCDIAGCVNMADFSIGVKRGIFKGTTDICKTCLNELYHLAGEFIVPASPMNMIKKGEMKKNER